MNLKVCPRCKENLRQSNFLDEKYCFCGYSRHWFERYGGTPTHKELKELKKEWGCLNE